MSQPYCVIQTHHPDAYVRAMPTNGSPWPVTDVLLATVFSDRKEAYAYARLKMAGMTYDLLDYDPNSTTTEGT